MDNTEISLLQGIDTIIIRVNDITVARQWYENTLGLVCVWEDAVQRLVVMDTHGATSVTLWQTDKKIVIDKSIASYPIFKTPDAVLLKDLFNRKGIESGELTEDEYVRYFFFYDPDGNVLEACQVKG